MTTDSPIVNELLALNNRMAKDLLNEALTIIKNDNNAYAELIENESDRLLSERSIKKICLKYRLRFLDINLFKNQIPIEAKTEIERLEQEYGLKFRKLRIVAPGELFDLERREKDPILVAELAKDTYFFIYKWGNEFNTTRVLQALPFRNVPSMVMAVGVVALLLTILIGFITVDLKMELPVFMFGWFSMWIGGCMFSAFISISKTIYPTNMIWKSKFLD